MIVVALAISITVVDQITKSLAFELSQPGWIEPGLNQGLALGIGGPTVVDPSVLALLGLAAIWRGTAHLRSRADGGLAVGLLAGGAFGNLLDRIHSGGVRDFLVGPGVVYNLADVALLVGAATLVLALHRRGATTG
jgi:signal peptidase II